MNKHDEDRIMKEIFRRPKTIAVVGMSKHPEKAAGSVPAYLINQGYNVIPVNPTVDSILGLKAYPDLNHVPDKIDIVNIFRPSSDAFDIIMQAVEVKKKNGGISAIWLQSGIFSEKGKEIAEKEGITFIQNMCIYVLHRRYLSEI